MRRLLPVVLLLAGCLEYEITVTTVVKPDGSVSRTLAIREKGGQTWQRFERPAAPYATEGDDEKGFLAKAELKVGSHPAGLRVLLGDRPADVDGEDPASVDGTVSVQAVDLLVGTLYRYHERVAIGTDPARFRDELPRWTDLGLRYTLETLKIAFPEIDFAPVEAKARADLLPALERAILVSHLSCQVALAETKAQGGSLDETTAVGLLRMVAAELSPLGISVEIPDPPWGEGDVVLDGVAEKAGRQLAERFLAPLGNEQRARVIDALFSEDALDDASDQATKKLFADEEALKKSGEDAQAFAASALGAYFAYGLFDKVHLRLRVELPGKVVRANGDLSHLPAVAWKFEQGDLVLAPPSLSAASFAPRAGAPGEGWDGETLARIEKSLDQLAPEQRAALEGIVAKALEIGWPEDPPGLDGDEAREAYRLLRDAAVPKERR